MKANNNWNYERWRTRDRLLEYDFNIVPPHPHSAGLPFVYPWEHIQSLTIQKEIFEIAKSNGYDGTEEHLWNVFSTDGLLITGTIDTFPIPGDINNLYFDTETGIIYYFKITSNTINEEVVARVGAAIVGISRVNGEDVTYLYIPIKALLIEDTILNCGDAAEYIG